MRLIGGLDKILAFEKCVAIERRLLFNSFLVSSKKVMIKMNCFFGRYAKVELILGL